MSSLKFKYALLMKLDESTLQQIKAQKIPEDPKGAEMVRLADDDLHVTLTTGKAAKPHSKLLSESLPQDLKFPEVKIKDYKFCYRADANKTSYVAFIENQDEFKKFVDSLYEKMGIQNPEPNRLYHITVANNVPKKDNPSVADPFGSIGDINLQDLNESLRYEKWIKSFESFRSENR